ncbi:unnamed protein product [Durusdinium trenchii]|uniref:Uncharacterized protein n=1 Tax=Durusdinium trenchii TaxID=1381693 RepID=A0ABP0NGC0_9DINO
MGFRWFGQSPVSIIKPWPRHACPPELPACEALQGFVHEETFVINSIKGRDQVIRGVPVAGVDENGHGTIHLHVRRDKQNYEFSFARALPGEKLNLIVTHVTKNRLKKKEIANFHLAIDERCSASIEEVTPRCQHFAEKCGGCSFQNLKYEAQLREKFELLKMRLKEYEVQVPRAPVDPPVPSPPFGWHARTEFRVFLRDGLQMGLHPEGSPVPVPLSRCHLHPEAAHEAFQALLTALRAAKCTPFDERTGRGWLRHVVLRSAHAAGLVESLATLVTVGEPPREVLNRVAVVAMQNAPRLVGVTWSTEGEESLKSPGWRSVGQQSHKVLAGRSYLMHDVVGMKLKISSEAFFRPNIFLAETLIQTVLEMSAVQPGDVVWDTFCGQGLFTSAFLQMHRDLQMVCIDRSLPALQKLQQNLAEWGHASSAEVLHGDLGIPAYLHRLTAALPDQHRKGELDEADEAHEADLNFEDEVEEADIPFHDTPFQEKVPASLPAPQILLVDPGRNGMPKPFRRHLLDLEVARVVYISSGRALLRDLAYLTSRGYKLEEIKCFDLQPHTAKSLEVVAHLEWTGIG